MLVNDSALYDAAEIARVRAVQQRRLLANLEDTANPKPSPTASTAVRAPPQVHQR